MINLNLNGVFSFVQSIDYNNQNILILALIFCSVIFLFICLRIVRKKKVIRKAEHKKPTVDGIIHDDVEYKTGIEKNNNEYVDVLVAIEEEMAAIRELYIGGYITKGIYISETDKLYEKAKIFGL
tara:strand:- start:1409 stop:1783 length:375 start_codon:yes stop_codon:yes gene_type:complete